LAADCNSVEVVDYTGSEEDSTAAEEASALAEDAIDLEVAAGIGSAEGSCYLGTVAVVDGMSSGQDTDCLTVAVDVAAN
jgi:hypothetical protein